ncbi:MAG: hypothetical protein ACI9Y1_000184 [Lentisphaeria bacterium]|jgi:hypothetical protein
MNQIYLLKNQRDEYLDKSGNWVPGLHLKDSESKTLYRSAFKDEAINQKVEFNLKHPDLRISLASAHQDHQSKVVFGETPKDTISSDQDLAAEHHAQVEISNHPQDCDTANIEAARLSLDPENDISDDLFATAETQSDTYLPHTPHEPA